MAKNLYGHKVEWYGDEMGALYYKDGEMVHYDRKNKKVSNPRPCPKCKKLPTPEGHDACLGNLPGVEEACCGHGKGGGYILFENGVLIWLGKGSKITTLERHKKSLPSIIV